MHLKAIEPDVQDKRHRFIDILLIEMEIQERPAEMRILDDDYELDIDSGWLQMWMQCVQDSINSCFEIVHLNEGISDGNVHYPCNIV